MIIYIVFFAISTLIIYLGSISKNTKIDSCCGFFAVFLLSLLAGMRDYSIGTDVEYYIIRDFDLAHRSGFNLLQYVGYISSNIDQMEFLYLVIQYAAARLFDSAHSVLFIISFIVNAFVYSGIKKLGNNRTVWLGWVLYCFVFYNNSLNAMRQAIAVSIIFWLFSDCKRLSWVKVLFVSMIASLFHVSGIVGLAIYCVYWLLEKRMCRRMHLDVIILAGAIFCILFYDKILAILLNIGIIGGKYSHYITYGSSVTLKNFLLKMPGILVYFLYWQRGSSKRKIENELFLGIMILDALVALSNNLLIERVAFYISIFEIRCLPESRKLFTSENWSRRIYTLLLILLLLTQWYMNYVYYGYTETVPYKFGILFN